MIRRTINRTVTIATEAPTATVTWWSQTQATTKATVGSAVSNEPRAPPNAEESRSRIRDSTVCASTVAGAGVTMSSLAATVRADLIGGIEDRRYAVPVGHPSVRAQIGPRHDAPDPTTAKPDEIHRLAAVVDLHHQGRHIGPRLRVHTANGATHAGLRAVHQVDDRSPTRGSGALVHRTRLELGRGPGQACAHPREQPGPAPWHPVSSRHGWSHPLVDLGDLRTALERLEVVKG